MNTIVVKVHPANYLSANDRMHWAEKARRTKVLRQLGQLAWVDAKSPHYERANLTVTITWPDRRKRDAHNAMPTIKALIDGMTHPVGSPRGVLPDDNDAHLTGPDLRVAESVAGLGTTVFIFDFEEVES